MIGETRLSLRAQAPVFTSMATVLGPAISARLTMAIVETGGGPGHAPAQRTYDKAGYTLLAIARCFKALQEAGDGVGDVPTPSVFASARRRLRSWPP